MSIADRVSIETARWQLHKGRRGRNGRWDHIGNGRVRAGIAGNGRSDHGGHSGECAGRDRLQMMAPLLEFEQALEFLNLQILGPQHSIGALSRILSLCRRHLFHPQLRELRLHSLDLILLFNRFSPRRVQLELR